MSLTFKEFLMEDFSNFKVGDRVQFADVGEDSVSAGPSRMNKLKGEIKEINIGNTAKVMFDGRKKRSTVNLDRLTKINESAQRDLADIDARIKSLRKEIGTPAEGRMTRANLQDWTQKREEAVRKVKREKGEVKTAEFHIPSDIASDVHTELHKMWKGKLGKGIPWGNFHGDKEGQTKVIFHDYTPGATSGKEGGKPVEQLIKYVKKHEVK